MKDTMEIILRVAASSPAPMRHELIEAGLSDDRILGAVKGKILVPRGTDVFLLPGQVGEPRHELAAACHAAAPGRRSAVISHRSAAANLELRGIRAERPEVTVVGRSANDLDWAIVHRTDQLAPEDVVQLDNRLFTCQAWKIVLDLGAVCTADAVERAFEDAFFKGLLTFAQARDALDRGGGRGRRGAGVFRTILEVRDPDLAPPESELELLALRALVRDGLRPEGTQVWVTTPDGSRFRLDFTYAGGKVLEANGRAWHSGRADLEKAERRTQQLVLMGYEVFPFGWVDVLHRRREWLNDVRAFLGRPNRRSLTSGRLALAAGVKER